MGWPSTTWSGCGGSWRSRHEDGRAASAARHVDPDTRSSLHGLLTPGSHAPEYGLFTSFFRSLLAGKKHFVDLAVQFGECAVGLLEKLFSPWVGFNNCKTVREKRKIIRERIKPSWLGPLVQTVRSFLERLPDAQYEAFLHQYEISDGQLGAWLEALANGVDLDDTEMVERLRRLELSPALIIEEFGDLRELIAEETGGDDTSEPPVAKVSLELEPFIHLVKARITTLRINHSRT